MITRIRCVSLRSFQRCAIRHAFVLEIDRFESLEAENFPAYGGNGPPAAPAAGSPQKPVYTRRATPDCGSSLAAVAAVSAAVSVDAPAAATIAPSADRATLATALAASAAVVLDDGFARRPGDSGAGLDSTGRSSHSGDTADVLGDLDRMPGDVGSRYDVGEVLDNDDACMGSVGVVDVSVRRDGRRRGHDDRSLTYDGGR